MSLRVHKSIFDIPELTELVQVYLNPRDGACLARSSNWLFQTIMPSLWEHVKGVSQLFALLPVLDNTRKAKDGGQLAEKTWTKNDLLRFNVYALWIKHLEVCRDRKPPPHSRQLDVLCHYSATCVLLPNLKSITCASPEGLAEMNWVLPFLSPSLISLDFVITSLGKIPELSPPDSAVLLCALGTKCPKLQTLSTAVHAGEADSDLQAFQCLSDDENTTAETQLLLGFGPLITSIHPLVSLAFSAEILDQRCFTTISTWPSLESLSITMDRDRGDYTLPELDDNSFPALTHLGLFWIHDMDTFQRIWDSPALTKKLTSLKLIPTPEFCFYTNIEFSDTLVQIFSVLAERSPSLQALWLRALHPDTSDPFYEASLPAFAALQILPLQSLYVDGIHFEEYWFFHQPHAFDDESVAKREAFIKHFATAFPALRELGFPLHTVPWTDCPLFHSHMPQLESLRFNFNLGTLKGKKVDLNNVPRCRCSPFRTLEANFLGISEGGFEADIRGFRYGDATRLVNYLFSIWPNVQIAAQPDGEDFEDYTPHYRRIALINNHLAALSLCNRDASIKYGDIKILNKESWARCEA